MRFLSIFPSPFVALGLIKVALTVKHQNSADQEKRRHKGLFSVDQLGAAEMLLLRKARSIRAAGKEQLKVQHRAGLSYSSPFAPIGPSEAVF